MIWILLLTVGALLWMLRTVHHTFATYREEAERRIASLELQVSNQRAAEKTPWPIVRPYDLR